MSVVGSVTRAYTLAVLAGTRVPQSAYRIAKLADLSPPNVYVELRKLARVGIVTSTEGGWILLDERTRTFFEGRGPLFERKLNLESKRDWTRRDRRRVSTMDGHPPPPVETRKATDSRLLREFSRSRTKNALLKAAGLRLSEHKRR